MPILQQNHAKFKVYATIWNKYTYVYYNYEISEWEAITVFFFS